MEISHEPPLSPDYFYKKKVIVYQGKKGYRFSVDAPILTDFLPTSQNQSALDIGTGCGIVSLLALYRGKFASIHGIEIQETLSRFARLNAEHNHFLNTFNIITGDFNKLYYQFKGLSHIFSNPPFYEVHRGRLSPNPEIRIAKTETALTLSQLLSRTYSILCNPGNLYLILPYTRYSDTMKLITRIPYRISRQRLIFSFKDGKPERFLVQLTNYDVSSVTLEPLIIFKEKGVYTEEMDRILTGSNTDD